MVLSARCKWIQMASPKTLTIQYMLLFSHLSVQLPAEQECVRDVMKGVLKSTQLTA